MAMDRTAVHDHHRDTGTAVHDHNRETGTAVHVHDRETEFEAGPAPRHPDTAARSTPEAHQSSAPPALAPGFHRLLVPLLLTVDSRARGAKHWPQMRSSLRTSSTPLQNSCVVAPGSIAADEAIFRDQRTLNSKKSFAGNS